jgi:tRNA-specific 2-thiouridylase
MKKALVAMSGGVDSSVAALLMKEAGFDVTGIFIKAWHPEWIACDWRSERRDAMRAAAHLRIPFISLDLEKEYRDEVAMDMVREYESGRVPNPDVLCNKRIKFGHLLTYARAHGYDVLATGHYAATDVSMEESFAGARSSRLLRPRDEEKDQTYFLWSIGSDALSHVIFPLANLTKAEARLKAALAGLPNARKKDSQGICFLGDVDLKDFLSRYVQSCPGKVLRQDGVEVGEHPGAVFFTIGQRHGFTVHHGAPDDAPLYVVSKDMVANTITVSDRPGAFFSGPIHIEDVSFFRVPDSRGTCMLRYRTRPIPYESLNREGEEKSFVITGERQTDAVPGQSVVFYEGSECVGGGIISSPAVYSEDAAPKHPESRRSP